MRLKKYPEVPYMHISIRFEDSRRGHISDLGDVLGRGASWEIFTSLRRHSRLSGPAERCYFPDLGFWGNQRTDCSRPRAGSGSSTVPPVKTGRWVHSKAEEPPAVESLTNPGVGCTLREEPRVATTAGVDPDNAQMPGVSSNGDRGPLSKRIFDVFQPNDR